MLQRRQQALLAFVLAANTISEACADGPYEAAVMASSPTAYWRFEESSGPALNAAPTTAPDGVVIGTHARNQASASPVLGRCIAFDGGGVRVPFSGWTQPSANFSVEMWAKAVAVTAPAHLAGSSRDLSSGSFKFVIYGGNGGNWIGAGRQGTTPSGGADAGTATTAESLQAWHHYAYVHDGNSGLAHFFVDGRLVGSGSFSMGDFATNSSDFMIALHDVPGFPYPFRGMIDEVAFYQRAIGADEILDHYCAASIPSLPGCCLGDLNHDHSVDGADIGLLLYNWGPCGSVCLADLNSDGSVNGGDIGLLLSGWGPCPN